MARGQYSGSRKAARELQRRKMESHFVSLAGLIEDEAQLAQVLDKCRLEYRPLMLQVLKPFLKFSLESDKQTA